MSLDKLEVVATDQGLLITGMPDHPEGSEWSAIEMSGQDYLLKNGTESRFLDKPEGAGFCEIETLFHLIAGFLEQRWTGAIEVDTRSGRKSVFLSAGKIAFASSDSMDDRLGEIIYQQGRINLDQLLASATQVTRQKRFGQVLLQSKIFDHNRLWSALKDQVRSILSSIFMNDRLSFSFQSGVTSRQQMLYLAEPIDILRQAYARGAVFRHFMARLGGDVKISLNGDPSTVLPARAGTFIGDFLSLVHEHPSLSSLTEASKLQPINTQAVFAQLCKKGYCSASPLNDPPVIDDAHESLLQQVLAYNNRSLLLFEACQKVGFDFPIKDLLHSVALLNERHWGCLYLDSRGCLTAESIGDLSIVCRSIAGQAALFEQYVCYLDRYLRQVFADQIPEINTSDGLYGEL